MRADEFLALTGCEFFTGVPDSQLRALCDCLSARYGTGRGHIPAVNEGSAAALAAGYHLATGKLPLVYLQNSGQGNLVNPLASLLHEEVYGIPCLFVIGWRGEPGVHDEPQHVFQGEVTLPLLDTLAVPYRVLSPDTSPEEVRAAMEDFRPLLDAGRQCAFVVRKGALTYDAVTYPDGGTLLREEAIRRVLAVSGEDLIISTTGKASRELFEARVSRGEGHGHDFLTVGSMGHCSSLALSLALHAPDRRFWILDGDGAVLMHMGALAQIGRYAPSNLIHVVLNNLAYESVGGMPTGIDTVDLPTAARACGYPRAETVRTLGELDDALTRAKAAGALTLLDVRCALASRADLGRPTSTPKENKEAFLHTLREDL